MTSFAFDSGAPGNGRATRFFIEILSTTAHTKNEPKSITSATLPFIKSLANLGWREALTRDPHLANGLNVHSGHVNHEAVARDLGYDYLSAADALKTA